MAAPEKKRLSTTPTPEALADLKLGDVVYLDGLMYTAREGVYMRALEQQANIPMELPRDSAANFHCSPAATIEKDGSFRLGSVTATASFRFEKWLGEWFEKSGAKLIVGKGGMSSATYKQHFVPNGAIYLTTVGYGTGALLGRGVENVEAVHWADELGFAQAMWVLRCNRMGPFIVASDLEGNCLFERENAKIAPNLRQLYDGTRPPVLKRYGESDDRTDEVIS
ncbi:MAG: fumarate hydratase C-terminal domain-containing protein [Pseudomonadota bacterium]